MDMKRFKNGIKTPKGDDKRTWYRWMKAKDDDERKKLYEQKFGEVPEEEFEY